jgi:3-hydroxyacyl-CoA dehydrogenase
MSLKIRRVAVLGAGVMGAQIAAHLAAAGVRTHLLDLASAEPPKDPKLAKAVGKKFRSTAALLAIENMKKLKPSPLASESILANLIPGNFDDDMSVLQDCDWVIEVVVERLDIKKSMLKRIAENTRPHIPITTNTSGLSLTKMSEDLDESFHRRFFGTHFFNPPRYMKLLEIIPHPKTDKALMEALSLWIEKHLGKGIVYAKDTINFIANRIGVFNMMCSFKHMADLDLNIETVDALTGKTMGRPPSATFRTMDVVGIDTFAHVSKNVFQYAPHDPYRELFTPPQWIDHLIAKGSLGQKSNSVGAYKKAQDDKGQTVILAYRPAQDSYVEQEAKTYPWMEGAKKIPDTIERLKFILSHNDAGAQFIWRTLRDTMAYSAILLDEIADNQPMAIDNGIKWGFNWEWGPFELWQGLGYDTVLERMKTDGVNVPTWLKPGLKFYRPAPNSSDWHLSGPVAQSMGQLGREQGIVKPAYRFHLPKAQNHEDRRVVLSNAGASLIDIEDGVACLVFHTKMNAINNDIVDLTFKALDKVKGDFDGLVIGNDAEVFSAGADLKQILGAIKENKYEQIDQLIRRFQGVMQMIKYAPFPSVSCPQGLVLGGGCEFSLHASEQILAGDTFAGLVEVGVGLIPAGGGTKELALRAYAYASLGDNADPMPFLQRAFMLIGMAKTSTSGLEAIEMGLYGSKASVTLARDYQILKAKRRVLELTEAGYQAPLPITHLKVVGDPGIQTFNMMLYNMVQGRQISPYDAFVGEKVATVLCGGEVDSGTVVNEEYLLELERRVFLELCHETKTQERIEAMLKTGKALRN